MTDAHPVPYCTQLMVRKLATFIPVKDLADSDIDPYIEGAMDDVDRATGKVGTYWVSTDNNFGSIKVITAEKAAAKLVRHYGPLYISAADAVKTAESLEKLADKELEEISEVVGSGGSGSGIDDDIPTASTTYSTLEAARMENPSQTVVTAYRSTDFV